MAPFCDVTEGLRLAIYTDAAVHERFGHDPKLHEDALRFFNLSLSACSADYIKGCFFVEMFVMLFAVQEGIVLLGVITFCAGVPVFWFLIFRQRCAREEMRMLVSQNPVYWGSISKDLQYIVISLGNRVERFWPDRGVSVSQ